MSSKMLTNIRQSSLLGSDSKDFLLVVKSEAGGGRELHEWQIRKQCYTKQNKKNLCSENLGATSLFNISNSIECGRALEKLIC